MIEEEFTGMKWSEDTIFNEVTSFLNFNRGFYSLKGR